MSRSGATICLRRLHTGSTQGIELTWRNRVLMSADQVATREGEGGGGSSDLAMAHGLGVIPRDWYGRPFLLWTIITVASHSLGTIEIRAGIANPTPSHGNCGQ